MHGEELGELELGLEGLDAGVLLVVHGVDELDGAEVDGVMGLAGEEDGADEDGIHDEVVVGVTGLTGVDELAGVLDGALDEESDGQSVQR